jgi:predicted acyltransferase
VVYSAILWLGNGFDCSSDNILAVVDRFLVGEAHLYHKSPIDPEGFLSSISAIAHTLIGFYVGSIFIGSTPLPRKIKLLAALSVLLVVAGLLMSLSMPFNKRIWSPSYTVFTCAIATAVLAALMFLIDYKGYRRATPFFLVFGVNPLFLYVVSEVLAIVIGALKVKPHIYDAILTVVPDPYVASAIYSLAFMLLLFAIGYPLYRRRIYIKI